MAGDDDNVQPPGLPGGGQVTLQSLQSSVEQMFNELIGQFNEFREETRPLMSLESKVRDLDQRMKVSDTNYSELVAEFDSRVPKTMSGRASIDQPNTVDLTGQSTSGPSGVSAEGGEVGGVISGENQSEPKYQVGYNERQAAAVARQEARGPNPLANVNGDVSNGFSPRTEKLVPGLEIINLRPSINKNGFVVEKWKQCRVRCPGEKIINQKVLWCPDHLDLLPNSWNTMNLFEDNIQTDHSDWLQTLTVIKSRERDITDNLRKQEMNQKMDNLFIQQVPAFTKSDSNNFQTYVEKFWEVATRQLVEDHWLAKGHLFNQISLIYPDICSEDVKPAHPDMETLTFKAYAIKLLQKFQPNNQKEVARMTFEQYTQKKQDIDVYFDEKRRLFQVAYGRCPTEMDICQLFRHLAKGMRSTKLADKMMDESRQLDPIKPDMARYKARLITTATSIRQGVIDKIYSESDALGCSSLSYSLITHGHKDGLKGNHKGGANNPITINQVNDRKKVEATSDQEPESEDKNSETSSEQGIDSEILALNAKKAEIDSEILALNAKKSEIVCWFCTKIGHTSRQCFDRQKGKAPHPYGKWAQKKNEDAAKISDKKPKKKGFKKGNKGKDIQQIDNSGQEDSASILSPSEHDRFLDSLNDLAFIPYCPLPEDE